MRIYVIGPVSGVEELNAPAFEGARARLAEAGYVPLVPHDFVSADADWQRAMRISLETIAKADGIALLDGWRDSRGARIEERIARELGIEAATVGSWCDRRDRIGEMEEDARRRRYCPRCDRILPVGLFASSAGNPSGRQGYCRECMDDYKHEGKVI